jgi:hypothetical protein
MVTPMREWKGIARGILCLEQCHYTATTMAMITSTPTSLTKSGPRPSGKLAGITTSTRESLAMLRSDPEKSDSDFLVEIVLKCQN